jgi:hypothetical protein
LRLTSVGRGVEGHDGIHLRAGLGPRLATLPLASGPRLASRGSVRYMTSPIPESPAAQVRLDTFVSTAILPDTGLRLDQPGPDCFYEAVEPSRRPRSPRTLVWGLWSVSQPAELRPRSSVWGRTPKSVSLGREGLLGSRVGASVPAKLDYNAPANLAGLTLSCLNSASQRYQITGRFRLGP